MVGTKTCRVCGKQYEACRSLKRLDGVFRWQDVACSPECGAIYLHEIMVSRGEIKDDATESVGQTVEDMMHSESGLCTDEDVTVPQKPRTTRKRKAKVDK